MSKFSQPVSMECPDQKAYEKDLRQQLLELGYEETIPCNKKIDETYVFATMGKNGFGFAQKNSDAYNSTYHIESWNPKLALAIAAMREGEEVRFGEYWTCISDVVMNASQEVAYIKGTVYKSEGNGCITDEQGCMHHSWTRVSCFKEHFRKATLQELIDKFTEKPFVLEDIWWVRVTEENKEACEKWLGVYVSVGKLMGMSKWYRSGYIQKAYSSIVMELADEYSDGYCFGNEITTEQFMEHVYHKEFPKEAAKKEFVPKIGDIIFRNGWIMLVRAIGQQGKVHCLAHVDASDNELRYEFTLREHCGYIEGSRIATSEEVEILFDALAKEGKKYNPEKFCIEDMTTIEELTENFQEAIDEHLYYYNPEFDGNYDISHNSTDTICEAILGYSKGDWHNVREIYLAVGKQLEKALLLEKKERTKKRNELNKLFITR